MLETFININLEITSSQEYFDGLKFDFARVLSDHFYVQHSLHMGSSEVQGGGTYSFSPTVITQSKKVSFSYELCDSLCQLIDNFIWKI